MRRPSPGSSCTGRSDRSARLVLGLLLAAGLLARIWSASYGLPDVYHPDEPRIVERAARFHQGDLNPNFFNWPSLYMYVLAGVYGVALGGDEGGVVGAFARNAAPFYLVGRLVTGLAGAATVLALYALARRSGGRRVAFVAAGLLAVDLLHVRDSHFVTTDVPMTCLVVVAVLLALRHGQEGRLWQAALAGLFGGLAASMKYPGGLALLALVVAHVAWLRQTTRPGRTWIVSPALAAGGMAAVAGFLLGTPYAVLTPRAFVAGVLDEVREIRTVQFGNEADPSGYLFHLVHSLPEAVGWGVCLLAMLGALVMVRARRPEQMILLAFPLPYLLVIGTWSSRFERYVIPLLPFVALAAAAGAVTVAARLGRLAGWRTVARPRLVLAGLALALVAHGATRVVTWHRLLGQPDTRALAADWIERAVPAGTRIALEPYSPSLAVAAAMLREGGSAVERDLSRPLPAPPPGLASPVPDRGYRVLRLNVYDLDRLLAEGVEYVVLSGFVFQRHQRACDRHPDPCGFYRALEGRARLVYAASPGIEDDARWVGDLYAPLTRVAERRHPGPSIRIYRLAGREDA